MLCRLHVMNYALIDDVEIEFGPGLNIITGETGAGKSILVGALGLVLGMRASPEVIRTGEKKCTVEAIFDLYPDHPCQAHLKEMGIETDGGELIVRREVMVEGRSRCFVNGLAIPVRALHDLGRALVDLHGQHEHQSLLNVEQHLDFLDGFGDLWALRSEVESTYKELVRLHNRKVESEAIAQRQRERGELLTFQVKEIATIVAEPGEDEILERERSVLEHAERLIETAVQLETLLYEGEESVADQLSGAVQLMDEAIKMDASLKPQAEELMALRYGVEELARIFTVYGQKVEHNPERLAEVTERLEALNGLKKKYGPTLEDVLVYQNKARQELDLSEALDASLQDIQRQIDAALASYTSLCVRLSDKRKKASRKLSRAIEQTLSELGMPAVQFCVETEWREDPEGLVCVDGQTFASGPRGLESGEFSLSTNPGEAVHPLVKVASGGEVSRIMLAMKTVLAHTDSVQVLIFDEIDLGISGRIAEVVGRQLKALSGSYQTISITHLPQIAKMADVHFSVRKKTSRGRTVTRVDVLAGDDRAEELAKMMGGETISDLTMEHAREMLEEK